MDGLEINNTLNFQIILLRLLLIKKKMSLVKLQIFFAKRYFSLLGILWYTPSKQKHHRDTVHF